MLMTRNEAMTGRKTWAEVKAARTTSPARRAAYEQAELRDRFGRMVRDAREAAGLTQVALAEQLGMTQAEISRLELGGADPRLSTLMRLAEVLGPMQVTANGVHAAA